MTEAFDGLVLAGGRSTRMGRDKAMLVVGGRTLLDRTIDVLRDAGAARVHVSGKRPGHGGIPDRAEGLGPVGGIASVLPRVGDGQLVVVPVDLPRLDAGAVQRLLAVLGEAPAAHFRGHPLPWAVRVDDCLRGLVDSVMRQAPTGPSMHALHAAVGGVEVPAPESDALRNVNTPADVDALAP